MDKDGYPDEEELQAIRTWDWHDLDGLMAFVHDLWTYADCGYWDQQGDAYRLSTGGWSGNEDIIEALQENRMFWTLCWVSSRRGGHYEFEVKRTEGR